MKKIYLMLSMACMSLLSTAQIYETNFEEPVGDFAFDKSAFSMAAGSGSNLVIESIGHDEYQSPKFYFNNGNELTPIEMSSSDVVYLRVKADFEGDKTPEIKFHLIDENGVFAENDGVRAVSTFGITKEWREVSFSIPDWFDNDVTQQGVDTTKIAGILFSINGGYGSFPRQNEFNDSINGPFIGTIYLDYVSIGESKPASGSAITVVTSFEQDFSTDVTESIWTSNSYSASISGDKLSISTAGNDEYDYVRYALSELVDLSSNAALEFTASAIPASNYTGNLGVKFVPVDQAGNRLEYEGDASYQSLTSTPKTVQVAYTKFVNISSKKVDKTKIAFVDVFVNGGFSSFPTTNELDEPLNTSFEGEIIIDKIRLGEGISVNGIEEENEVLTSFYPNPATKALNFRTEAHGGDYTVYNSAGVEVANGVVDSSVDVSSLETGLYFIEVINNDEVSTKSFIKQ